MIFEYPMEISFFHVDTIYTESQTAFTSSEIFVPAKFRIELCKISFDENQINNKKCDAIIIGQKKVTEQFWSFASQLRSTTNHMNRLILSFSENWSDEAAQQRAHDLCIETHDSIESCLNSLSEIYSGSEFEENSSERAQKLSAQRLFDNREHNALLKLLSKDKAIEGLKQHASAISSAVWLNEENFTKAEQNLRLALSQNQSNVSIRNMLARLLSRHGNYSEALMLLEHHSRAPFMETLTLLNMARIAMEAADHSRAERCFIECHQRDKSNPEAELGLGKIAFARGNLEKASIHFTRAGRSDELASYFNQMAIALVNQQRYKDALAIYQSALKVLPSRDKHHFIHYNIALAQKKRGALLEAADSFATSLELSPEYEKAIQGLSEVLRLAAENGTDNKPFEHYRELLVERKKT